MAWEAASQKYVREYGDLLAQAISGSSLVETERDLLRGALGFSGVVVHLQSGHGLDDVALVQAGAKSVVGIDYSQVAVRAAQRRADELGIACRYVAAAVPGVPLASASARRARAGAEELGIACRYVAAAVPGVPLASASADLVYTGKGALVWMADLAGWAREVARLLRPSARLRWHCARAPARPPAPCGCPTLVCAAGLNMPSIRKCRWRRAAALRLDRKSTRLNSSHLG